MRPASVHFQVALHLPRRYLLDVVEPFGALGGEEVLEQMVAEDLAHQRILFELVERLTEIAGQLIDTKVAPLAVAHRKNVLVDWRARVDLLLDSIEAGAQHG